MYVINVGRHLVTEVISQSTSAPIQVRSPIYVITGKAFRFKNALKRHNHIHSGERRKPYVCDQCGKAFSRASDLTRHKRVHTGEKPCVCNQCGKSFFQPGDLSRHKLTHSGEKPHVCDQCGKAFRQAGSLTAHKRTHTGEKTRICDQCGKAFTVASSLATHKCTHAGEKPYTLCVINVGAHLVRQPHSQHTNAPMLVRSLLYVINWVKLIVVTPSDCTW